MTRPILAALAAAATFAASPARAQFEGRLDYVMTGMPGGHGPAGKAVAGEAAREGKFTVYVSPAGARSEVAGSLPDVKGGTRPLRFVTLFNASEPRKTVMLNEERRTYAVMVRPEVSDATRSKRKVERIGSGRVAGYACEKVRITSGGAGHQEICVTKELGKAPILGRMASDEDNDVLAELRGAGMDGIPVAMRTLEDDGKVAVSMELISAKKQRVPASLLAVPAGYTETSMGGLMATPEQAKQMEAAMKQMQEQMKRMTPEQRKQMEEVMKQVGAGKK
jgi:hypothetical protein